MTPNQIQEELKKRKVTQKQIARLLGISEMSVSKVVNKIIVSDRIMSVVAGALGIPKEEVFPEYYYGPKRRSTSKAIGERRKLNRKSNG